MLEWPAKISLSVLFFFFYPSFQKGLTPQETIVTVNIIIPTIITRGDSVTAITKQINGLSSSGTDKVKRLWLFCLINHGNDGLAVAHEFREPQSRVQSGATVLLFWHSQMSFENIALEQSVHNVFQYVPFKHIISFHT